MSYKSKKLKKDRFYQLKRSIGLVKTVLWQVLSSAWKKQKGENKPIPNGTKEAAMIDFVKVSDLLLTYDRMPENPDRSILQETVRRQIEREGLFRISVFVCPKFDKDALGSQEPEKYMPVKAVADLFEPRIPKILSLREDLIRLGVMSEINLIIGDNDAEEYIWEFMPNLKLDRVSYALRRTQYRQAFETRAASIFGANACRIWSLGELGVSKDETAPVIAAGAREKEMKFFQWLFSEKGPYGGLLRFSQSELDAMVEGKYRLYGSQGKFLEMIGGILLQTEGPGVWRERTNMLRCTGSLAIPVIYPWIRTEELKENNPA